MDGEGYSAQIAVVGSMLIDERCAGPVMAVLREEDFSDATCRNTFRAVREQFLAGGHIDYVVLEKAVGGGDAWVRWAKEAMDLTPTAANVLEYAAIVKEKAVRSGIRDAASALAEQAMSGSMEEITRRAMAIPGLLSESDRVERVSAAEGAADFIRRLGSRERPEYLPWGLPSMDDGSIFAELGDYILLGGYPSAGKTLLSIQMALAQARKYRVIYYTLETRPSKVFDRLFAHLSPLELRMIKTHEGLGEAEFARAAEASAAFVKDTPVDVVKAAGFTAEDIAADALSHRAQVVYIDYVQKLRAPGQKSRYDVVTAASDALQSFAHRHNIAVVALAQLSRPEKTQRSDRKIPPDMSSLKESGQLEQDADLIFLLWRHDDADNDHSPRVFKVAKNKDGPRRNTVLAFDGATQTMTDMRISWEEYRAREAAGSVQSQLVAHGKAIKRANSAKARMEQMQFRELPDSGNYQVPF